MVRAKRPIPPQDDKRTLKRARVQREDAIVIEDDDLRTPQKHRQSKPLEDDSDIEIIDDPVTISVLKKWKGKERAKPLSASQTSLTTARRSKSARVVYDVDTDSEVLDSDEKLARKLAMEWAAEESLESSAGPSSHSVTPASGSSSRIEEGAEPVQPSQNTPPSLLTSNIRAQKPKAPNLDVPYINLPNPQLQLEEIKRVMVASNNCSNCGEAMVAPRGLITETVDPEDVDLYMPPSLLSLIHLECPTPNCGTVHCRGCLNPVSCYPKCKQAKKGRSVCEVARCCAEVRAIALIEALSSFDKKYLADKESAETRTKAINQQSTKQRSTVGPGGTGYATGGTFDGEDEDDEDFDMEMLGSDFDDDSDEGDFSLDLAAFSSVNEDAMEQQDLFDALNAYQTKHLAKGGKTKIGEEDLIGASSGPAAAPAALIPGVGGGAPGRQFRSKSRPTASPTVDPSEGDLPFIQAFTLLTHLLPAPYVAGPAIYDLLPHPSLGALILMSYVPTVLAQLLRNDSVVDWISRRAIYHAILTLLKRMADCELIIPVLVGHRPEFTSTMGLAGWIWDEGQFVWKRDEQGKVEMALPLLEHFKKLKRQAEAFLHTASVQFSKDTPEEPSLVEGLSLCQDIVGAQADIKRAMEMLHQILSNQDNEPYAVDVQSTYGRVVASSSIGRSPRKRAAKSSSRASKGKGKASESSIQTSSFNLEKEYVSACERLSFDYVSLGSPNPSNNGLVYSEYNFAPQLQQTANATRRPKDRIHFAKELAVMATSLPPGIWVRIDEVRNDAIKVMIAGPQGTPYAGGLFEFDCFIPLEYPNKPPIMHLRTTGGGTVRFNPNLYNCGKVCLSLLGTWSGSPEERWTSKSTLLQVLVSIQSMILNEAPYYNEPGHGQANLKAQPSIKYNRDTSLQTVRWGIVEWLKDEHRDGIWKEVIQSHFSLRQENIRQQLSAWAKDDPRIKAYHASLRASRNHGAQQVTAIVHKPFGGLRLPAPPTPSQTPNMDLVAEFDEGMQRVEAWHSEVPL